MKRISAIIADDEEQLRIYLKKRLNKLWSDLEICGEAKNGIEALDMVKANNPDIAFLDIKMPGFSGIEVAEKIAGRCRIVFITAFDEYAIKAFENEAMDYLLKPITDERLKKTIKRLKKDLKASSDSTTDATAILKRLASGLKKENGAGYLNWIKVQHGDGIRLIPVDDVVYFKASDKYTVVMTKEGESLIRKTIRDLTDELDPERFWRIHRGTIVNVHCIAKTSRSLSGSSIIKLIDRPEVLSVSRSYTHLFRQM